MEVDPDFEYDAPKWFDFTANQDGNLSLNDSWFENVHPLHEPKDPSHHDATKKPLLAGNNSNKAAPTTSKGETNKPSKKNYNSKKSLGIKTIRTRRGQHESLNKKGSAGKGLESGKVKKDERGGKLKSGKKDSHGGHSHVEGGRASPEDIYQNMEGNFTPPWANSPLNKTGEVYHWQAKDREGSSCMNDSAVFSPQRVLVNPSPGVKSPMSPGRVRCLNSVSSSLASPFSPKSSLLAKAVGATCAKPGQLGKRRRLLPAIPDLKTNPTVPPNTYHAVAGTGKDIVDCSKTSEDTSLSNHKTSTKELLCEANKPLCKQDVQAAETPLNKQIIDGYSWREDNSKPEELNTFSKSLLDVIPEKLYGHDKGQSPALVLGESKNSPEEKIEALLQEHKKKIAAASSYQYDENGRKIRTAVPNFCPAPTQVNKSSSSSSLSTASKRPASSSDKPSALAKQKRRSCVAAISERHGETDFKAQSTAHSICNKTSPNTYRHAAAGDGKNIVDCSTYETSEDTTLLNHKTATKEGQCKDDKPICEQNVPEAETPLDDKYSWREDDNKPREFNTFSKRPLDVIPEKLNSHAKGAQSHALVLDESKISPGDRSIEALLKEHNKRIAAAKNLYDENGRKIRTAVPNFCPSPSQVKKSSSSSSTAFKRPAASSSDIKPSTTAKQKRRSCAATVSERHGETDVRAQSTSNSISNKKAKELSGKPTTKQKRRSCVAVMQSSGRVNNTEKELRDLIAQHNSRVTAKKS